MEAEFLGYIIQIYKIFPIATKVHSTIIQFFDLRDPSLPAASPGKIGVP